MAIVDAATTHVIEPICIVELDQCLQRFSLHALQCLSHSSVQQLEHTLIVTLFVSPVLNQDGLLVWRCVLATYAHQLTDIHMLLSLSPNGLAGAAKPFGQQQQGFGGCLLFM